MLRRPRAKRIDALGLDWSQAFHHADQGDAEADGTDALVVVRGQRCAESFAIPIKDVPEPTPLTALPFPHLAVQVAVMPTGGGVPATGAKLLRCLPEDLLAWAKGRQSADAKTAGGRRRGEWAGVRLEEGEVRELVGYVTSHTTESISGGPVGMGLLSAQALRDCLQSCCHLEEEARQTTGIAALMLFHNPRSTVIRPALITVLTGEM
jgi:hypothetical protein